MIIKSFQNERIKELKKQKDNKFLLFLDNPKLAEEAIKANYKLEQILVDFEKKDMIFEKFDVFKQKEIEEKIIFVSPQIIERLSDVQASQGVLAFFKPLKKPLRLPKGNFLILDNIQDAGNVGTILRSALGANFKDVYLLNCAKVSNSKTLRSSMGAVFKLNIFETSKQEFLHFIENTNQNLNILTCDMQGKNLFETNFSNYKNFGFVLGNEGNGVSEELRKICKDFISIPMENNLESLNVAVAGSIIMYYSTFQIWNVFI